MQTTLKEIPSKTKAKERLQTKRWANIRAWNKATKKSKKSEGVLDSHKDTLVMSAHVVVPILFVFGALYYREAQQMAQSAVPLITPINLSDLEDKEEVTKKSSRPKYYESAFDTDED